MAASPAVGELEGVLKFEGKVKGLPPGWRREVVVRKNGLSAGKTDVYYYSPCGKKFRSKPQIARFLGEQADLTCFDFSRAGTPGDGTQRRRARDRNPTKKIDFPRPFPLVRPLSNNPLRPSGPIRRTCGVIKLPVTWVAPPNDDELRNNLITGNPNDPKQQSPINVIVQSLWEKRLFGVKAYDHVTGTEISATKFPNGMIEAGELIKTAQLTPIRKPQSPRNTSPTQSLLPTSVMRSPPPIAPLKQQQNAPYPPPPQATSASNTVLQGLLQQSSPAAAPSQQQQVLGGGGGGEGQQCSGQDPTQGHLSNHNLLYLSLQQQTPPSQSLSLPALANGPLSQPVVAVPLMVTDSELKLQEERVRLLRQKLMAAESTV